MYACAATTEGENENGKSSMRYRQIEASAARLLQTKALGLVAPPLSFDRLAWKHRWDPPPSGGVSFVLAWQRPLRTMARQDTSECHTRLWFLLARQ